MSPQSFNNFSNFQLRILCNKTHFIAQNSLNICKGILCNKTSLHRPVLCNKAMLLIELETQTLLLTLTIIIIMSDAVMTVWNAPSVIKLQHIKWKTDPNAKKRKTEDKFNLTICVCILIA